MGILLVAGGFLTSPRCAARTRNHFHFRNRKSNSKHATTRQALVDVFVLVDYSSRREFFDLMEWKECEQSDSSCTIANHWSRSLDIGSPKSFLLVVDFLREFFDKQK
jgi:hypothetical protein